MDQTDFEQNYLTQLTEDYFQLDTQLYEFHCKMLKKCQKIMIPYGTAGFRDDSRNLYLISFRVGIFIGLFSKSKNDKIIGIQISASHNKYTDNGLKITGWDGGMFDASLEMIVQQFCNKENLIDAIQDLFKLKDIFIQTEQKGQIIIGEDTRPSCPIIKKLIKKGIDFSKSIYYELGQVTTPQLQFAVWANNVGIYQLGFSDSQIYTNFYRNYFTNSFRHLYINYQQANQEQIIVDCADGVGGYWMKDLKYTLSDLLNINLINIGENPSDMNNLCGSDFVQVHKIAPKNLMEKIKDYSDQNLVCLSFDGDGDRLVFYIVQNENKYVKLLDGDRLSYLFSLVIKQLIDKIDLFKGSQNKFQIPTFNIGIIQTAYANGASTSQIQKKLNIQTKIVPTGVKHLHAAAKLYDIGIYFEANGHGTILISEYIQNQLNIIIHQLKNDESQTELLNNLTTLNNFINLASQATGDSICNFLLVIIALKILNISTEEWLNFYHDYPSRIAKCKVNKKQNLKTNFSEDKVIEPKDNIINQHGDQYRCFIRASGTEDVIRIYCEGPNLDNIDSIINLVENIILTTNDINEQA